MSCSVMYFKKRIYKVKKGEFLKKSTRMIDFYCREKAGQDYLNTKLCLEYCSHESKRLANWKLPPHHVHPSTPKQQSASSSVLLALLVCQVMWQPPHATFQTAVSVNMSSLMTSKGTSKIKTGN